METDEGLPDYLASATLEDDDAPKRTRRRRRSTSDDDTPRTRAPRNSKLTEELLEGYVSLATDVATVMPTVSGVLIHRAERTVDGIVSLAQGHPRVMKALRTGAKFTKGADVLQTVLLVVVAAMVDMGRIPLDHMILDTLGDVSIVKGPDGKPVRDAAGRIAKERMTLRDIHNAMTGAQEDTEVTPDFNFGANVAWSPMPPGPMTVPPMNWTPR